MALKLLNFDPHSPPNTRKVGDLVIIFNFPVAAKDEFDKWGNWSIQHSQQNNKFKWHRQSMAIYSLVPISFVWQMTATLHSASFLFSVTKGAVLTGFFHTILFNLWLVQFYNWVLKSCIIRYYNIQPQKAYHYGIPLILSFQLFHHHPITQTPLTVFTHFTVCKQTKSHLSLSLSKHE